MQITTDQANSIAQALKSLSELTECGIEVNVSNGRVTALINGQEEPQCFNLGDTVESIGDNLRTFFKLVTLRCSP